MKIDTYEYDSNNNIIREDYDIDLEFNKIFITNEKYIDIGMITGSGYYFTLVKKSDLIRFLEEEN